MNPILTFLLLAMLATLATLIARSMRTGAKAVAVAEIRRPPLAAHRQQPAAQRKPPMTTPRLETIEWTEPPETTGKRELEAKLRDRYAAARFPGVFDGAGVDHIIGTARHYFEEEEFDRAQELLALAIARSPDEPRLRLAQIEIAFLMREPSLFVRLAAEFQAAHAGHPAWGDVARLGHAIAPEEPRFALHPGTRSHDHYGPWPDMPNWIDASWDLTSEVLAADFHRAMNARVRHASPAPLLLVA